MLKSRLEKAWAAIHRCGAMGSFWSYLKWNSSPSVSQLEVMLR